MTEQLALHLQWRDSATFENFYASGNETALAAMYAALEGRGDPYVYVWAPQSGAGRSHLLQAACHAASLKDIPASYLSLRDYAEWHPSMLEGFEQFGLVCLDDVDAVAGQAEWEEACFHLYNRLHMQQTPLFVAANGPPRSLNWRLPDAVSRFMAFVVFQLHPLDDAGKCQALMQRAHRLGLTLSEDAARFLLHRCPRNPHALFACLEQLDTASWQAGRGLTIPFIKSVLGI